MIPMAYMERVSLLSMVPIPAVTASVMVTSAAVITLAVPTAVMAFTDISTAVRAYNVLSLPLIYYAHREEQLAMVVCCPIPLKEGCKSVMK